MRVFALAAVLLVAALPARADRLADIRSRGSLICATLSNIEPLGYTDPQTRQIVGFDVDTCAAVAKHMGLKLEHKGIALEQRIPELTLGRVDVVAAALGYSKERAQQIDFTAAHYQVPIKILVKSASGLTTLADLAGKRVSAVTGASTEIAARKVLTKTEVVGFQAGPGAFLAMMQDKVDGFSTSQAAGAGFLREMNGTGRYIDEALVWEATALGVRKDEPTLLAAVNKALEDMEAAGEIDGLWTKWYGPQTKFAFPREKKLTPIANFAN